MSPSIGLLKFDYGYSKYASEIHQGRFAKFHYNVYVAYVFYTIRNRFNEFVEVSDLLERIFLVFK